MSNQDQHTEENLADDNISHMYQQLEAELPASKTDEAIIAYAKQRVVSVVAPKKTEINWVGGFSVAASIVLVSVLYWTQMSPQATGSVESVAESDFVANADAPMSLNEDASLAAPANEKALSKQLMARKLAENPSNTDASFEAEIAALQQSDRLKQNDQGLSVGSAVLPECQLSMHGGFTLRSTPLAKYTSAWSLQDKEWLISMLNARTSFDALKGVREENLSMTSVAMMDKTGFSLNYNSVISMISNCKNSFDRATE